MHTNIQTLSSVDNLLDPDSLRKVIKTSEKVHLESLDTLGYSGSQFFRVKIGDNLQEQSSYFLKLTTLEEDWFSHRSKDQIGREATALLNPQLSNIHKIFHLPYKAIAIEEGRYGLLMNDVSNWLLSDERAPLKREDESLILDKLAKLHASHWQMSALKELPWLQSPSDFIYIMGPHDHKDNEQKGGSTRGIQDSIRLGWQDTLGLLPEKLRKALCRPAIEIAASFSHLPMTLIHGDTKIANFGISPDRELCAFDWAFVGWAPCTFELGWYLAVNASRLSDTKEETIKQYRNFLEIHLSYQLDDKLWEELIEAGIVAGALMLLWSKGSAVVADRPSAKSEWSWWLNRLENWTDG